MCPSGLADTAKGSVPGAMLDAYALSVGEDGIIYSMKRGLTVPTLENIASDWKEVPGKGDDKNIYYDGRTARCGVLGCAHEHVDYEYTAQGG